MLNQIKLIKCLRHLVEDMETFGSFMPFKCTRKEDIMPAFVFANIQSVINPARFAEYQGLAEPTVVQYGGKFLAGGTVLGP